MYLIFDALFHYILQVLCCLLCYVWSCDRNRASLRCESVTPILETFDNLQCASLHYHLLYFTDKTEQFKTFTKVFFLWVEIKCVITFKLFATLHYFILSKYVLQKIHRGDRKHDSYKIMILRILIQSQGIKGFEGSKKSHWAHCASF